MVKYLHISLFFSFTIFVRVDMEPFSYNFSFFLPCFNFACFSHNFAMPLFGMLFGGSISYLIFFIFGRSKTKGFIVGDDMVAIPDIGICRMRCWLLLQ